jgi:hypothetical protein
MPAGCRSCGILNRNGDSGRSRLGFLLIVCCASGFTDAEYSPSPSVLGVCCASGFADAVYRPSPSVLGVCCASGFAEAEYSPSPSGLGRKISCGGQNGTKPHTLRRTGWIGRDGKVDCRSYWYDDWGAFKQIRIDRACSRHGPFNLHIIKIV